MRIIIEDISEERQKAILDILTRPEATQQAKEIETIVEGMAYDVENPAGRINMMNHLLCKLSTPISIAESGSPTKTRVACSARAWKVLEQYGEEVFKETFEVAMAAWPDKYRFDNMVIKELSSFIGKYWGQYDKATLIDHIRKKVGKSGYPISARDFAAMAKKTNGDGSTTRYLYNLCKKEGLV